MSKNYLIPNFIWQYYLIWLIKKYLKLKLKAKEKFYKFKKLKNH